ncbi:MAG: hypothetical protein WCI19_04305 [Betaproteobacteria bacterium]|nr:hypothetical protein [Rhodocyclales bacterium]
MFKIVFVALSGKEREIFVPAETEQEAVLTAVALRDFGMVISCNRLAQP